MSDLMAELGALALGSRLKRLVDSLMQDGIRVYRDSGLHFEPRWFPVYYYLSRRGPSAITDIARGLGVSHPSVNQVAKELIKADLAATYKDTSDKRKRVLALTRQGKQMLPRLEVVWRDIRSSLEELVTAATAAGPVDEFLDAVGAIEVAIRERDLHTRFLERHDPERLRRISLVPLTAADEPAFRRLNEAWISQFFELEAVDRALLSSPATDVIDPGGQILLAKQQPDGEVLATCAVIRRDEVTAELAKMTVAEQVRGQGIGKLIARAALDWAREAGFRKLYLETNRRLAPALRLYRELGFVEKPAPSVSNYARADVYLELTLRS